MGLVVELNPYTLLFAGTEPVEVSRFLAGCGCIPFQQTPDGRKWPMHRSQNVFFAHAARSIT